jgi:hypothetical protein
MCDASAVNLFQVLGRTASGRYLAVLLAPGANEFWVVSARDMNLSERRLYGRQGK